MVCVPYTYRQWRPYTGDKVHGWTIFCAKYFRFYRNIRKSRFSIQQQLWQRNLQPTILYLVVQIRVVQLKSLIFHILFNLPIMDSLYAVCVRNTWTGYQRNAFNFRKQLGLLHSYAIFRNNIHCQTDLPSLGWEQEMNTSLNFFHPTHNSKDLPSNTRFSAVHYS